LTELSKTTFENCSEEVICTRIHGLRFRLSEIGFMTSIRMLEEKGVLTAKTGSPSEHGSGWQKIGHFSPSLLQRGDHVDHDHEYSHFVLTKNIDIRNLKHAAAAARAAAPPPESWELRRSTREHLHPSPLPSELPTPAQGVLRDI
jgi:hypothetical protein